MSDRAVALERAIHLRAELANVVRLASDRCWSARGDVPEHAELRPESAQEVEEVRTALFGNLTPGLHPTNDVELM